MINIKESLAQFIANLREKNQTTEQREQAARVHRIAQIGMTMTTDFAQ
jgi:hypothetical protein